ncbi:hypothetical protein [Polymorphospora rubra]|uniref:Uncharacterized protein n=1 Tax=Polymorphospora rubra TaxID=338584 RepID=A0A810N3T1_9ACTN|nr:hypothetical protein [Polymorphospora rubra]BCJ66145.1 hypothetical protein Prubr_31660 [Polymorphospora rubra]
MTLPEKLNPQQFQARADEQIERIRATAHELPLYGLANWTGSRMVSNWMVWNDVLEMAGLGFGAFPGSGPRIEVMVSKQDGANATLDRRREIRHELEPPRTEDIFNRIERELQAETPGEAVIAVEGEPQHFSVWQHAGGWIADTLCSGHRITLKAHGVDPASVELCRVHDIEPYLDGRRTFLADNGPSAA